jgi:hypothetical protein
MAMDFAFTPADGLENTTTYESKPVSGARAREQIQEPINQIRDRMNGDTMILILMEV